MWSLQLKVFKGILQIFAIFNILKCFLLPQLFHGVDEKNKLNVSFLFQPLYSSFLTCQPLTRSTSTFHLNHTNTPRHLIATDLGVSYWFIGFKLRYLSERSSKRRLMMVISGKSLLVFLKNSWLEDSQRVIFAHGLQQLLFKATIVLVLQIDICTNWRNSFSLAIGVGLGGKLAFLRYFYLVTVDVWSMGAEHGYMKFFVWCKHYIIIWTYQNWYILLLLYDWKCQIIKKGIVINWGKEITSRKIRWNTCEWKWDFHLGITWSYVGSWEFCHSNPSTASVKTSIIIRY